MSLWKRPGVPPLHSYTMPGVGWRGRRAGIEWEWFSFRAARWVTMERQRITRFGEDQRSVIRTAAARTGFSFRTRVSLYQWFKPVVFRSLPLLLLNAWELEFPHDPHPTSRYFGPMVRPLRQPNDSTADQRHDLQRLAELEEVLQHDRLRRLIYASFGT